MKFKYSKFLAKPSDAFPDLKEVWRPQRSFFEWFSIGFDLKKKVVDLRPKYL